MNRALPDNWKWVTLGAIAQIEMGQSPPGVSYNKRGSGTPFLQGKAEFGNEVPIHVQFTTQPCKVVGPGTILMSVRAPVGDVNIADQTYCIGRGLAGISSKKCDGRYLFHYLSAIKPQIESKGTGSTFKAISKSILKELLVPIPPLKTQHQIVAILDKAEETRRLRAKANGLTPKLLQSVFLEMFGDPVRNPMGWPKRMLGDCAILQRGKFSYRPRNEPRFYGGKYPFIQTGDIVNSGGRVRTYSQTLNEEGFAISKMFKKGTIVMAIAANIGDTAILEFDSCFPDSVVGISPIEGTPEYYEMMLRYFKNRLLDRAPETAQRNINLEILSKIEVPLPPLSLQTRFTDAAIELDEHIEWLVKSEMQIRRMLNSMVNRAFMGELVA